MQRIRFKHEITETVPLNEEQDAATLAFTIRSVDNASALIAIKQLEAKLAAVKTLLGDVPEMTSESAS